jgi:hypothetical protein
MVLKLSYEDKSAQHPARGSRTENPEDRGVLVDLTGGMAYAGQ